MNPTQSERTAVSVDDRPPHDAAWRMYLLLALFDRRDGSYLSRLVQSAREGYEREDSEGDAWDEFDALWNRLTSAERLELVRTGLEAEAARLRDALEEIIQPWTGDVEGYEIARKALGRDD